MFSLFVSCSPRSLHEARSVVAEADSLWLEGGLYSDSAQLAQAYTTLEHWQRFYADDYAHACYHYGKLLRKHEDPVSAMQVFINATHSPSHDYHILGRVYSNIGDICHLANEFQLAYDMYDQSGAWYLRNRDSLLYYYDLNNMAFELAKQRKGEEALALLSSINEVCDDHGVLVKTIETKAILYKSLYQYDSVLYYSNILSLLNEIEPTALISKAQAFCYLHKYDSATYYAKQTLKISDDLFNLNNAYYILIHCDSINNGKKVYQLSADRADVQKLLEIRQGKLSQAVQLLEQDLNRVPDWHWLYAVITTLIISGSILTTYVCKKHKRHQLLSQQINDLEDMNNTARAKMRTQIEERCVILAKSLDTKTNLCWNDYEKMCRIINQQFGFIAQKLQDAHCLSEKEVRLCVLTLLNLSYEQMAELLYYAPNGIGKFKMRVAYKLGTTAKNLRFFLIEEAIK